MRLVMWDDAPRPVRDRSWAKGLFGVLAGTLVLLAAVGFAGTSGTSASPPGGSFAFLDHQPGTPSVPVTWSSCKPIHVVVNDAMAPPEGWDILMAALDQVHEASGLKFVVDGRTSALPEGSVRSPNGIDWDPVLIAWTTPEQAPELDGSVDGFGGSSAMTDRVSGKKYYVTGRIALDTPQLTKELRGPHGTDGVRGVIVHELGHVLGLAHVDDDHETMNKSARRDGQLGPGDRIGFGQVGAGPCYG